MSKILLEGLEFYAYHGCFKEEQKIGCSYTIDIELHVDISLAVESDNLTDTINYSDIYEIIKQEMLNPSKLIEHVAGRIVNRLMSELGKIEGIIIKIYKLNPPLNGKAKAAGIVLEKWKNGIK